MMIKKSDRKEMYSEILHLMLQGKNKEAFYRLVLMCSEDTGLYMLTDYDAAIEDLERRKADLIYTPQPAPQHRRLE